MNKYNKKGGNSQIQTSGYPWGEGGGIQGLGSERLQTIGCKRGSRMCCTTQRK